MDKSSEARSTRTALKEHAGSGMSADAFAASKGFSSQRLRYWKRRLAGASLSFVAMPLAVSTTSALTADRARIEVACDDFVLRVREDLDVEHLARIAFALAGRAPRC